MLRVIGCSHHNSSVEVREQIAFSESGVREALAILKRQFPDSETVLLSTCNRVELYAAADRESACPTRSDLVRFFSEFHNLRCDTILDELFKQTDP